MTDQRAPELPAEVLERIFSVGRPGGEPGEPLLDARQRLRCQLVCTAWRHALDVRRWPLWQLNLQAQDPEEEPAAGMWLDEVRPGVRHLRIELGGDGGYLDQGIHSLTDGCPAVDVVYHALQALQPINALQSLSLTAPFPVVERFVRGLGRFTGLRQLELRAEMGAEEDEEGDVVECWSVGSVVRLALLRHLPPQLQSLTLANCYCVHLEAAGTAAEPASSASPAQLLPAVTQLNISGARAVLLDLPLPSLADLTISDCEIVSLEGEGALCLPQLTSLQLHNASRKASLRCNAMPALARLSCSDHMRASDSFSALRRLTHLHLNIYEARRTGEQLVAGVAPFLHSMAVQLPPRSEWLAEQAAQALATAGASQLTCLEFNSTACLAYLPAWPQLQELLLAHVYPTNISAEQQTLLAAATSLRRLGFHCYIFGPIDHAAARRRQLDRMEELRLALGCTVEQYFGSCY